MGNTENNQVLGFKVSRKELNNIINQFNGLKKGIATKVVEGLDYVSTDDFEKGLDKNIKKVKRTVKVVGTVATVALFFCPSDGPFGEIASILATSGFAHSVDKLGESIKQAYKAGKRIYVGSIKKNGEFNVSSVVDADTVVNANNLSKSVKNIGSSISEIGNIVSSGRKR